jgi:hypothetical protein
MGLFRKKDDTRDTSAEIVKIAGQYIELNAKYQKLQQDVQQKHDTDKEEEIRRLKLRIDDQQREINDKAQRIGSVMVPDPRAYGGQRLIPARAVDAWTACVQSSAASGGSATVGPFTFAGGSDSADNKCDAILRQSTNP